MGAGVGTLLVLADQFFVTHLMCGSVSFQRPHKQRISAGQCDLMLSIVMHVLCGMLHELLQLSMPPEPGCQMLPCTPALPPLAQRLQ